MSYTSIRDARDNAVLTIPISASQDTTLSIEQAQSLHMKLTASLTADVNVIIPAGSDDVALEWAIENATSGAHTLTIKNTTGTGVAITQGKTGRVTWDGTNFAPATNDPTASGFAASGANTNITSLTGITAGITGAGGMNLAGPVGGNSSTPAPWTWAVAAVSFATDANHTATAAEYAAPILRCTSVGSLTATRNLVLPLTDGGEWEVENLTSGSQAIQAIGASGTGITIGNGRRTRVRANGTNIVAAEGEFPDLSIGQGTVVTKLQILTATYDPASLAANTGREDTVTVTGLTTARPCRSPIGKSWPSRTRSISTGPGMRSIR